MKQIYFDKFYNTSDNIYDIIIKNVSEDYINMSSKSSKDKWEVPQYSKSQINKAGKTIVDPNASKEDYDNAIKILNNWRASHAYPLQVICSNLRLRNPNAIVVQRLKRLESITGKIERFPDMSLYRMQDLGGCRVIVNNIEEVYESLNRYKNSRIRHKLKRETDYIQNPKTSGYRSYHMIYQFHSDSKETYNKNMLIEIQFRTQLQHTWATAVEMMGIYTKSNLKSSQGNEEILRFFVLVSSLFALQEDTPLCPDTPTSYSEIVKEIKEIDRKNHIISALSGLNVVIDYVGNKKIKNQYYILILDYEIKRVVVRHFNTKSIETATKAYGEIEKIITPSQDAVLVSASSFDALRTAYPNYFTDISGFVDLMRKIIS